MDLNDAQPETSAQSEPHTSYKVAYIVVGILSVLVLIAVATPFTLKIFQGRDQAVIDKQVVTEDTMGLKDYQNSSSVDAQEQYLSTLDQRLAEDNVSDPAKNLLLLRKAVVLATARGDAATLQSKVAEATKIFVAFINRPNPNASDLYFRDFSIVALTRLQLQCCNVSSDIMSSVPMFSTRYNEYLAAGYSKALSALLTLDVATSQMSPNRQSDAMNRLNSLDIAAKILDGYGDELKQGTKDALVKELGDGIAEYPALKTLTFNDMSIAYEAGNKLAIAYDFFKSNQPGGKSATVNTGIDRQYEDVTASINAAMTKIPDKHGLNEVLFYNQIYYLESLDRRYGDAVNTDKKNASIATLLNILATEPTVADIGKLYFQGQQKWKTSNPDEWKKLSAFTHFVELGKTNADIAAYLKTINVTP